MPKNPKPKRKKQKRGPKEERLIIADPQRAIDSLLKKKTER